MKKHNGNATLVTGLPARTGKALKGALDTIGSGIAGARDTIVGRTKLYWKATDTYVLRNPWTAVGISAGIALLTGMVLGRKGKK